MPMLSTKPTERKCPTCNGTGFPPVKQPAEPGRKIYLPRCERCGGKGWVGSRTEPRWTGSLSYNFYIPGACKSCDDSTEATGGFHV